nr:phospho-N-acetylmuramoyl-pentapeptide-transferase [Maliibacterium massiliense]
MPWLQSVDGVWTLLLAALIALLVGLAVGPVMIPALQKLKCRQTERDDGPQAHLKKSGTPTMGGILIVLAIFVASIICTSGDVEFMLVALLVTVGYGLIGFLDDYIKVVKRRSLGLKAYQKIIAQVGFALILALYAYRNPMIGSKLYVPIVHAEWDLGIWYIPFTVFVVIATTNSVNLTDGLDGLASSVTLIVMATFGVIINAIIAQIAASGASAMDVQNMRNLLAFSGAATGACLAFLRFNRYPAKVFMGDTGSMALGGAVVVISVLTRTMLIVPILGGMFMVSSISDIIQVASYKLRHKRVFKMAPLHHHFELCGMHETRIVWLYVGITLLLALITIFIL